jgi:hypothetical protein
VAHSARDRATIRFHRRFGKREPGAKKEIGAAQRRLVTMLLRKRIGYEL